MIFLQCEVRHPRWAVCPPGRQTKVKPMMISIALLFILHYAGGWYLITPGGAIGIRI